VCEAVAAQRGLAAKAGLELRTDVSGDLPDVRGDHDRLLQIFENLIGNAVKFTPRGGSVVVGATRRGRAVSFWVKDTGEGIPAEDLPHVFDRFWQARKRRSDGAGLGLAIVKALVEAHGGRSWVESAPGGGSTFCFTIPASIAPVRAAGEPDAVPPAIR
jgi:signal transduction histidine kinase